MVYWLKNKNEHGIQASFLFHLYTELYKTKKEYYIFQEIEQERLRLINSNESVLFTDLGTGNDRPLLISKIAKSTLSDKKISSFLFRVINHFDFTQVIELGTSLGINTCYLASANTKAKITTFEGCPNIQKIAKETAHNLSIKNIDFILGDINQTLSQQLLKTKKIDLFYIDANHTYEATMNYYNMCFPFFHQNTIVILDDINWSIGMDKAWNEIKNSKAVTISINLFRTGILFYNNDLQKEEFYLR